LSIVGGQLIYMLGGDILAIIFNHILATLRENRVITHHDGTQ